MILERLCIEDIDTDKLEESLVLMEFRSGMPDINEEPQASGSSKSDSLWPVWYL